MTQLMGVGHLGNDPVDDALAFYSITGDDLNDDSGNGRNLTEISSPSYAADEYTGTGRMKSGAGGYGRLLEADLDLNDGFTLCIICIGQPGPGAYGAVSIGDAGGTDSENKVLWRMLDSSNSFLHEVQLYDGGVLQVEAEAAVDAAEAVYIDGHRGSGQDFDMAWCGVVYNPSESGDDRLKFFARRQDNQHHDPAASVDILSNEFLELDWGYITGSSIPADLGTDTENDIVVGATVGGSFSMTKWCRAGIWDRALTESELRLLSLGYPQVSPGGV